MTQSEEAHLGNAITMMVSQGKAGTVPFGPGSLGLGSLGPKPFVFFFNYLKLLILYLSLVVF